LQANPDDPLFSPLDADDPDAAEPTFAHLAKELVRVVLPLPDNMDAIDFEGNVVTAADRSIFVWRGVPSVANTAVTGPYQRSRARSPATAWSRTRCRPTSASRGSPWPTSVDTWARRCGGPISSARRSTSAGPKRWTVLRWRASYRPTRSGRCSTTPSRTT
jgi:hypothetical protein